MTPEEVVDLKALTGDASDNIPGVKGVGPKTAISLLNAHLNLDGIYAALDQQKGALKKKLETDRENAYRSRMLAEILIDIPLPAEPRLTLGAWTQRPWPSGWRNWSCSAWPASWRPSSGPSRPITRPIVRPAQPRTARRLCHQRPAARLHQLQAQLIRPHRLPPAPLSLAPPRRAFRQPWSRRSSRHRRSSKPCWCG